MQGDKREQELLREISEKLDRLIGLTAAQGKDKVEQIRILSGLGFNAKTTRLLIGVSHDNVRQYKSKIRRRVRTRRKRSA